MIYVQKHDIIWLFRNSSGRFRTVQNISELFLTPELSRTIQNYLGFSSGIVLDGSGRFSTISQNIFEIVLDGPDLFLMLLIFEAFLKMW